MGFTREFTVAYLYQPIKGEGANWLGFTREFTVAYLYQPIKGEGT